MKKKSEKTIRATVTMLKSEVAAMKKSTGVRSTAGAIAASARKSITKAGGAE